MSHETKPLQYLVCLYLCLVAFACLVNVLGDLLGDLHQEAIDYCEKHGLDTTEKKIGHYKRLFKAPRDPRAWLKNPKSEIAQQWADEILRHETPQREPGQDDEERGLA